MLTRLPDKFEICSILWGNIAYGSFIVYAINTEKKADYWEVEALFDLCFAPGREALSSYRLRENSKTYF